MKVELPSRRARAARANGVHGAGGDRRGRPPRPARSWRPPACGPPGCWSRYYSLGLGLAGLCFVAIHYATGSTWSVAIRRVPEALAGTLPFSLALLAILFIVHPQLYGWTTDEAFDGSPRRRWPSSSSGCRGRFSWSGRRFTPRIWIVFGLAIRKRSRRQDDDGDPRWTHENFRLSAAFLVLFGITVTLASFDWLMSLEYHWFSTIFGVYNFAGLFQSGLAAIILVAFWLERAGPLRNVLNESHLHDLGKLLFAFSVFWMYIWFSQYMLIWYTNIPEETSYFVRRGQWRLVRVVHPEHVPQLGDPVPRAAPPRRQAAAADMAIVAGIVLLGRWLDVYLMVFPAIVGDITDVRDMGARPDARRHRRLRPGARGGPEGRPAVPIADPELVESLQYTEQGLEVGAQGWTGQGLIPIPVPLDPKPLVP